MALEGKPGAQEIHQVALSLPDDPFLNTIQLVGYDVVVPLEADLDGDPLTDDVVRLVTDVSSFSRTIESSSPDAVLDEEHRLVLYRFRDVPPGVYRVETLVRDHWYTVIDGLEVRVRGVFFGDEALGEAAPTAKYDGDPDLDEDDLDEPELDHIDYHDSALED